MRLANTYLVLRSSIPLPHCKLSLYAGHQSIYVRSTGRESCIGVLFAVLNRRRSRTGIQEAVLMHTSK